MDEADGDEERLHGGDMERASQLLGDLGAGGTGLRLGERGGARAVHAVRAVGKDARSAGDPEEDIGC